MKILVTNDDGINAIGIKTLVEKLKKYSNDILVVAPSVEMSATSHKLTLREGVEFKQVNDIVEGVPSYMANATPADCVKLGIIYLGYEPDIVFSGINNGFNHGDDIMYSGTIAAASEAAFLGYKGIAVSCKAGTLEGINEFDNVFKFLLDSDIYIKSKIININFVKDSKGIKITHQGRYPFDAKYIKKEDGKLYISAKPNPNKYHNDIDTDVVALQEGYISISPLTYDRTDILLFQQLKK